MTQAVSRRFGLATAEEIEGRSGIEVMRAMVTGELPGPPMADVLGFHLVEVGEGFALFEGVPTAALLNPQGTVHGGWALALIDSATGCAAHTMLGPGARYTTVETKTNFTRPILPDTGVVRAEGRVISSGRRIITCDARISDGGGRLLAHGTSTLLVL